MRLRQRKFHQSSTVTPLDAPTLHWGPGSLCLFIFKLKFPHMSLATPLSFLPHRLLTAQLSTSGLYVFSPGPGDETDISSVQREREREFTSGSTLEKMPCGGRWNWAQSAKQASVLQITPSFLGADSYSAWPEANLEVINAPLTSPSKDKAREWGGDTEIDPSILVCKRISP